MKHPRRTKTTLNKIMLKQREKIKKQTITFHFFFFYHNLSLSLSLAQQNKQKQNKTKQSNTLLYKQKQTDKQIKDIHFILFPPILPLLLSNIL